MRSNYDYLLAHPYEFPMFFMRYSKPKYMPKSDLRFVLVLTLVVISAMQYLFKKSQCVAAPHHPPVTTASPVAIPSPLPTAADVCPSHRSARRTPVCCRVPPAASLAPALAERVAVVSQEPARHTPFRRYETMCEQMKKDPRYQDRLRQLVMEQGPKSPAGKSSAKAKKETPKAEELEVCCGGRVGVGVGGWGGACVGGGGEEGRMGRGGGRA